MAAKLKNCSIYKSREKICRRQNKQKNDMKYSISDYYEPYGVHLINVHTKREEREKKRIQWKLLTCGSSR